jgi:hypothetical protein
VTERQRPRASHATEQRADARGARLRAGERAASPWPRGFAGVRPVRDAIGEGSPVASVAGVHVHEGPRTEALARMLDARAFQLGSELGFAHANDASPASPVFWHELGHVADDDGSVQRYTDPTANPLDATALQSEPLPDLQRMEEVAVTAFAALKDPETGVVASNLALVQAELRRRNQPTRSAPAARVAADVSQRATPAEIRGLQVMIDILIDLARMGFDKDADTLIKWLETERSTVENIAATAVLAEGDRLETMTAALAALVDLRTIVPADRSVAVDVAAAQDAVAEAMRAALTDLPTPLAATRRTAVGRAVAGGGGGVPTRGRTGRGE